MQNSDLIFAKILPGRSLRPYLWSPFALMARMAHFQGQTSPRGGKPSILTIFVCYRSPSLLVIKNSDLTFAKNLPGRPLRHYIWSQLALIARMTHFHS